MMQCLVLTDKRRLILVYTSICSQRMNPQTFFMDQYNVITKYFLVYTNSVVSS